MSNAKGTWDEKFGSTCTAQRKGGDFCEAEAWDLMPYPVCERHALSVFRAVSALIAERRSWDAAASEGSE